MAKQEKKISVNELDAVYTQFFQEKPTELDYYGLTVQVKRRLDLKSMLEFANDVTESCFHETAGFLPEMMDFAIRHNMINYYTNIRLPQNLEKQYELLYGCDIIDQIYTVIDRAQLDELIASIRQKIDDRCDTNAQAIRLELQRLIDVMNNTFEGADHVFSGVSADALRSAVQAIADRGDVDEGRIAQAVLNVQEEQSLEVDDGGGE